MMDMDEIGYFIFMEEQEQEPQEAKKTGSVIASGSSCFIGLKDSFSLH